MRIVLAQTTTEASDPGALLFWILATLVGLAILGITAFVTRKKWLHPGEDEIPGFTLEDLRLMRERGELSEEEYRAARQVTIGSMRPDSRA
ncbi:MAG: SHOCT domain-containing protein [Phycisphaerales bacterium]